VISEWMKVMLEEISRKKAEAAQGRIEEQTRRAEQSRGEEPAHRDGEAGRDEPVAAPRSDPGRAQG
jgi:hypothetical protein